MPDEEKLLFIDTNIFVNCAIKETESSDIAIFEKILSKLILKEILLIIPINIKNEVLLEIENSFQFICENLQKRFALSEQNGKQKKKSLMLEEIESKALKGIE